MTRDSPIPDATIDELYGELIAQLVATHQYLSRALEGDEDTPQTLSRVAGTRAVAASDDPASTNQQKAAAHAALVLLVMGRPDGD